MRSRLQGRIFLAVSVLIALCPLAWILIIWIFVAASTPDLESIGSAVRLTTDYEEWTPTAPHDTPVMALYSYDERQYLPVQGIDTDKLKLAIGSTLPGLRINGDNYLILDKWVNYAGGVALTDGTLEQIPDLEYTHLFGNRYTWRFDGER